MDKYTCYILNFLEKVLIFEREVIKDLNLIVRLNKNQTLIESFFLYRNPRGGTEYSNFFGRKAHYRDINLYFAYDKKYKQWFSSAPEFFNEAICEKVTNKIFNLKAFARKYYYVEKKGNGYATGHLDQKKALGNRGYLMPIIFDRNDIWIAPNEIFYTTANAVQMRGRTFLTQKEMKHMGSLKKVLIFEREVLIGLNLIARLNKNQTLIESFFLQRNPRGGTEYSNFFGGKSLL